MRGEKTFITSGMRADFYSVAVRTGGPGMGGISLLLIERDTPGFSRTPLKKMGWWASDTATLHFDDCRVPIENLIGPENGGFKVIMANFNDERLGMAYGANGFARVAYEEALAYARMRETFGKPLIANQVIRHKLVDMAAARGRDAGDDRADRLACRSRRLRGAGAVHAQEPGHPDAGLLRFRGGADLRRRRLHARQPRWSASIAR